ncbi:terminase large subunit [Cellulomonas sp. ES6]|uniref:terminase large subunit n=1 Tax=Cellulomonas sp. ES6 TaxID=3039384 RepID=UPI0024B7BF51|nr:terminase large subunit [Cellulomonas sp. ES6]WHP18826.1 terminase large subunit [Cellulomonas sp. ES6]
MHLIPWERWLLIHLLELDAFGTLRFRKALVIVARQNGKTLVAAILAAFFLYVDSVRWPLQVNPRDFVIVGAAQKLDIAMKPWSQVRQWGGPDDPKIGIAYDRVPLLQSATRMPRMVNGETELVTHEGAVYRPRTFDGARGYSSARLILDELRQQYDYEGWSAIEKSATAMFDSLLLAFSNAGTYRSVVLKDVRQIAHESVEKPGAQWFVAEWSAKPDASLDDREAFAQANPSAGYLPGMTLDGLMQTAAEAKNKSVERIEVLCQWVTQNVEPYIEPTDWKARQVSPADLRIPKGARTVWSVDTSADRSTTWVAAAVKTEDGRSFVTVRTKRAGIVWAVEYLQELAEASGQREVAVQAQGCPSVELIPLLEALTGDDGKPLLTVHQMDRPTCAIATGQMHDHVVRDKTLVLTEQPDVDLAIEGGLATKYAENRLWSREASKPVDVAGVCAMTWALYALENLKPEPKKPAPPTPRAAVLEGGSNGPTEESLLTASF